MDPKTPQTLQEKFQAMRDHSERLKTERAAAKAHRPNIVWPKRDPEKTRRNVDSLLKFFYEGRKVVPDELAVRFAARNSQFKSSAPVEARQLAAEAEQQRAAAVSSSRDAERAR